MPDIVSSVTQDAKLTTPVTGYLETDPFWVERRTQFLAAMSTAADPAACGTCRDLAEARKPVKHDECQQRATLLQAPDHPDYEILAGFSLEENAKLPARFHVPVFDDCGKPNAWLCAVCWEEGVVTGWPCKTATEQGTKVFSPAYEAETAAKKQAARIAELEAEAKQLRDRLGAVLDLCDREQRNAMRWENPIPVPDWVASVQRAALGDDKRKAVAA